MKKDLTEMVFILDRSGSMGGLETDTIGGFNSLIAKQKTEAGSALVTTALFDDRFELLHDRIDIRGVEPITDKDYFVRGSTALLDAVGRAIEKILSAHRHTADNMRPGKVIFFITTDGMENASREYTYEKVREMIEFQKMERKWEFIFLGANIDAVREAAKFGIRQDRAANYHADAMGTSLNYRAMSDLASNIRADKEVAEDWKARIEEDFVKRGGKSERK